jgi:predicted  nucleic acid-binding Zn-ribbon protein
MSESEDFQLIVEQAQRFSEQFGALLKAADKLAEFGDLQRAESEARQAAAKAQRELDILNSEKGAAFQKVHDAIEAELKYRYREHERLLATESTLRVSVRGLEEKATELRAQCADLERRIAQGEARHADVNSKIAVLRTSLDR